MENKNPPKGFLESPEALEYLQKLQAGRIKLPEEANVLEREMIQKLTELAKSVGDLTLTSDNLGKEITQKQAQQVNIQRDIDRYSGEMIGYTKMLLSAEGARREIEDQGQRDKKPEPGTPLVAVEDETKPTAVAS